MNRLAKKLSVKKLARKLVEKTRGAHLVAEARRHLITDPASGTGRRAAIIPPATPGSIGDAAMVSATVDTLRQMDFKTVDLLYGEDWPLDVKVDSRIASSEFFYGGSRLQQAELIDRLRTYSDVYFIGADVIDGAYNPPSVTRRISLLTEALNVGRNGTVLGSSFNAHADKKTTAALAEAPVGMRICARDPISCKRMEVALHRPIIQTADLAFLVETRADHPDAIAARDWIRSRRQVGDCVIALNANYLQFAKHPLLAVAYATLARILVRKGASLLLVPHDTRTDQPDAYHLRAIAETLGQGSAEKTYMIDTLSPGAIKAALGSVDLLVTGRMHAMILALGLGTPAIALTYQGKFEGIMDLLGLPADRFLMPPEAFISDPGALAKRAYEMMQEVDSLRKLISDRVPEIIALSRKNFH